MPEYLAPGVFVEETSFRSKSIQGVGTSTTAFVGPTLKGPIGELPEVITSFGEFERVYGNSADLIWGTTPKTNYLAHAVRSAFDNGLARLYVSRTYTVPAVEFGNGVAVGAFPNMGVTPAAFTARQPGRGLNAVVSFFEKKSAATDKSLASAPDGSIAIVGGNDPAVPAVVNSTVPGPFAFADGDRLRLNITDSAGTNLTTTTVNGTSAVVTADTALPAAVDVPADTTVTVTLNGGNSQTITLPTGTGQAAQLLVDAINEGLTGGYAVLRTDTIEIGSDRKGSSSQVNVDIQALLGFTTAASATSTAGNNVANLSSVSVAELGALIETRLTSGGNLRGQVSADGDGNLVITTVETGAAVELKPDPSEIATVLQMATTTEPGADGTVREYHQKTNGAWVASGGVPALNVADPDATTVIVTVNVVFEDSSGIQTSYENLGLADAHPRYLGKTFGQDGLSKSETVAKPWYFEANGATAAQLHASLFAVSDSASIQIADGHDGNAPLFSDQDANNQSVRDALEILEDIQDISIVAAPGYSALEKTSREGIQNLLITHCRYMKYRFAVLDTSPNLDPGEARLERAKIDERRAAMYYPWVVVPNPAARPGNDSIPKELTLPPSGFVSGVYARTDITRGVWKAPANEVVQGALRFEKEINKGQQETLNPEGVNCLRYFFGRGNRVWGARTASSDPEWMYVNVMRYFIYLESSIDRSTQWAVFEPNGPALWDNVRDTISNFLFAEWKSGALLGGSPDEAFFVRCDRSTMTQADLDNGRMICEIGVAVVKPAEFVIFRIGQKTADA